MLGNVGRTFRRCEKMADVVEMIGRTCRRRVECDVADVVGMIGKPFRRWKTMADVVEMITPSLPWRSARVPQHPFPRSVDRYSGADSMATSFPGSYSPGFFNGDSLKIKCSYHLCLQMSLNSELELLPQLQK